MQNQDGNHPNRWDRTGKLPYRQYRVKMDGSNRVTLRNRRFLRKIDPVCSDESMPDVTLRQPPSPIHRIDSDVSVDPSPSLEAPVHKPRAPVVEKPVAVTPEPTELRRSTRERTQRRVFEAQTRGKSHSERVVDS